jgi:hypothetical protein
MPAAWIHHRGKGARDVDLRMVQYAQVPVDLDAAVVADRQARTHHQLGRLHSTRPDEHATLHQLAALEPEAFLGRGRDHRIGADLHAQLSNDRYLRVLDHPEIYVAGDLASVVDPRSGHVLPPLAQVALEEGETVARNLDAELEDRPLEAFTFHDKGFVVSVGTRRGVADIAGITSGGRLAHLLKDLIEWEYRQSVTHLRGWDPMAR